MTVFGRRIPRHLLIRAAYLLVGVKLGLLWLAQGDRSPWAHALRLVALMAIVMVIAAAVRRWRARRGGPVAHHPIGRFLMVKLALVAIAVATGLALENAVADVDLWVALGLAAVVTVAGPLLHPWLVNAEPTDIDHADTAVAGA